MQCDFLFRRGYVITNVDLKRIDNSYIDEITQKWEKDEIGNLAIYKEPNLENYTHKSGLVEILLLGIVCDPINNISSPDRVLKNLCEAYKENNSAFFDYLDCLSGRFLLLVCAKNNKFLLQDAVGLRPVFYDINSQDVIVSSNPFIIAAINNYSISELHKNFIYSFNYDGTSNFFHFPGLLTSYENVYKLTPNTMYDLENNVVERFFPRGPLNKEKFTPEFIREISLIIERQIKLLAKSHRLAVSLTSGIDSRLTLAATKGNSNNIWYFTTDMGSQDDRQDSYVASKICSDLGIKHTILTLENNNLSSGFLECFNAHTSHMALDRVRHTEVTLDDYPPGYLQIHSGANAIAKSVYLRNISLAPSKISAKLLSHLYNRSRGSEKFVVDAFTTFIDRTNFNSKCLYNYNFYDLFYWEHRLGSWGTLSALAYDIICERTSVMNNRLILKKVLSSKLKHRVRSDIHYEIIKYLWPETLKYPVNPHKKTNRSLNEDVKKKLRGLRLRMKYQNFNLAME